jgi:hypothetical protein
MIRTILHKITGRLPCRLIDVDGAPYMERYYVGQLLGATIYLHRFVAGDGDRHVHDHPWDWSLGLVLAGGYEEERLTAFSPTAGWHHKIRRIRPWRPNFIGRRTFHRVTNPRRETWTLFIHGRRTKGWGFLRQTFDHELWGSGVLYHQPAPATSPEWWREAPPGREIRRPAA